MSEIIARSVARLIVRAPAINPRSLQEIGKEIILTRRPGWSAQGKYELAIPGGKFEDVDFVDGVPEEVTTETMINAGLLTAVREVFEELGMQVAPQLIHFVLHTTNESGWTSYVYAADLEEKPSLLVLPESAGTVWMSEEALLSDEYPLFADHGKLIVPALTVLSQK